MDRALRHLLRTPPCWSSRVGWRQFLVAAVVAAVGGGGPGFRRRSGGSCASPRRRPCSRLPPPPTAPPFRSGMGLGAFSPDHSEADGAAGESEKEPPADPPLGHWGSPLRWPPGRWRRFLGDATRPDSSSSSSSWPGGSRVACAVRSAPSPPGGPGAGAPSGGAAGRRGSAPPPPVPGGARWRDGSVTRYQEGGELHGNSWTGGEFGHPSPSGGVGVLTPEAGGDPGGWRREGFGDAWEFGEGRPFPPGGSQSGGHQWTKLFGTGQGTLPRCARLGDASQGTGSLDETSPPTGEFPDPASSLSASGEPVAGCRAAGPGLDRFPRWWRWVARRRRCGRFREQAPKGLQVMTLLLTAFAGVIQRWGWCKTTPGWPSPSGAGIWPVSGSWASPGGRSPGVLPGWRWRCRSVPWPLLPGSAFWGTSSSGGWASTLDPEQLPPAPDHLDPSYTIAALVVLVAGAASALPGPATLDHLDLIGVLKDQGVRADGESTKTGVRGEKAPLWGVAGAAALVPAGAGPSPGPPGCRWDLGESARRTLRLIVEEEGVTRVRDAYVVAAPLSGDGPPLQLARSTRCGGGWGGGPEITPLPAPPPWTPAPGARRRTMARRPGRRGSGVERVPGCEIGPATAAPEGRTGAGPAGGSFSRMSPGSPLAMEQTAAAERGPAGRAGSTAGRTPRTAASEEATARATNLPHQNPGKKKRGSTEDRNTPKKKKRYKTSTDSRGGWSLPGPPGEVRGR